MTKQIAKNQGGRPTKLTDETVSKLESIFKVGGTVEEACSYALITKETYYQWIKKHESFLTKMTAAKHFADIVAKNIVVDSIVKDRNVEDAKWWLKNRVFKDNAPQQTVNMNVFGDLREQYSDAVDGEQVKELSHG